MARLAPEDTIMDFDMLGLKPRLIAALAEMGIADPTPIQRQAIPPALQGRDVLGLAQTGTGKTAAFGLPLAQHLLEEDARPAKRNARALILAPTRELVNQIGESLDGFIAGSHLRVAKVVGGVGINPQIKRLERGVDLLVATPGRLLDLMDRGAVTLAQTRFLVLDEADQMLDMGFIHDLRKIAAKLPAERQTMLFSATMPKEMESLAATYLTKPVRVQVATSGQTADKIEQSIHFIAKAEKPALLLELLQAHPGEAALVFARTKHGSDRLAKQLTKAGVEAVAVHGNRSQGQRMRALEAFSSGDAPVMVATDVAARGLDIPVVKHVYNYELPNVAETYVHRIGRTARAGRDGAAITLCAPDEMGELKDIEKLLRREIPVASGRRWSPSQEEAKPKRGGGGGGRRGGGGGRPQGKPAGAGRPQGARPGGGNRRRRPRKSA
ncbi:DEAD/DEAH box helicase [Jannaschia seohaensis]|uniref:ATP-dependent RNA helicase RhlE n=1 Tax=Jannaschia seohaensis TaxID=475081 RepID=A0A2Y9B585_9RHOB|nr:DEAD/DEAH box helicase [Jannaschia seohaensis]PWJ14421.1 ATP-dependent RNA helicase RhlE [Jannaschia seohaensis]SSA50147.1 ATP-dependent RNA helicase RhlE [Jannaschia seohaensis]